MPPVRTKVKCYLCSAEGAPLEMNVMGSPALGPVLDFALSVTWLCPQPCFEKARHSKTISPRIYAEHDARERENKANLSFALKQPESTYLHLATLPDGLKVTERDIERVAHLDGDYRAENLQDEQTIRAAFNLLRNYKYLPYCHIDEAAGVVQIWNYSELLERLTNLERSNHATRNLST